jgi:hypothetical protein
MSGGNWGWYDASTSLGDVDAEMVTLSGDLADFKSDFVAKHWVAS